MSRAFRKKKNRSKLITTSFNEKELVMIDALRKFLAETGALDKGKDGKATYYAFMKLAVYELVKKINSTLFKEDEEMMEQILQELTQ